MMRETLNTYVKRVVHEKGLTVADVERRANGSISDSYVHGIMTGRVAGSQTVNKLKALARGLDVNEEELFAIARGVVPCQQSNYLSSEFARISALFEKLPEPDRRELNILLETLTREIERRTYQPLAQARA